MSKPLSFKLNEVQVAPGTFIGLADRVPGITGSFWSFLKTGTYSSLRERFSLQPYSKVRRNKRLSFLGMPSICKSRMNHIIGSMSRQAWHEFIKELKVFNNTRLNSRKGGQYIASFKDRIRSLALKKANRPKGRGSLKRRRQRRTEVYQDQLVQQRRVEESQRALEALSLKRRIENEFLTRLDIRWTSKSAPPKRKYALKGPSRDQLIKIGTRQDIHKNVVIGTKIPNHKWNILENILQDDIPGIPDYPNMTVFYDGDPVSFCMSCHKAFAPEEPSSESLSIDKVSCPEYLPGDPDRSEMKGTKNTRGGHHLVSMRDAGKLMPIPDINKSWTFLQKRFLRERFAPMLLEQRLIDRKAKERPKPVPRYVPREGKAPLDLLATADPIVFVTRDRYVYVRSTSAFRNAPKVSLGKEDSTYPSDYFGEPKTESLFTIETSMAAAPDSALEQAFEHYGDLISSAMAKVLQTRSKHVHFEEM